MFDFIKEQEPTVKMIAEARRRHAEAEEARAEIESLRNSLRQAMNIQKGKAPPHVKRARL